MRNTACVFGLVVVSATVVLGATMTRVGAGAAGPKAAPSRPNRVLIISAPRLTWDRLLAAHAPNLQSIFDRGAVASLAVRGARSRSTLPAGYGTLSAGNRAAAQADEDKAFGATEVIGGTTGAARYTAATGRQADGAATVFPSINVLTAENTHRLYGTQPGLLGSTLAVNGYRTAVIANADEPASGGGKPESLRSYHRAGAIGLMDRSGRVRGGDVTADLLVSDPAAPGGTRLDATSVGRAFDAAWTDRSVVLVELSDLERADDLPAADTAAADRAVSAALTQDDAIVGRLLASVGPNDLVMVVSPAAPRSNEQLTPFAIVGPGFVPGVADSGTTQRPGYVALTDIAPTVLGALQIKVPVHMNGAGIRTATRTNPAKQLGHFRSEAAVALFHSKALGPLNTLWSGVLYIAVLIALGLVVVATWGGDRIRQLRWLSELTRLGLLGVAAYPIPSFLMGLVRYDKLGSRIAVALVLIAASGAIALSAEVAAVLLSRGRPHIRRVLAPVMIASVLFAVLIVDMFIGGPMEIATVFGSSPIGAGRFSGYGNQAYSFLAASIVVIVCGCWAMVRGRRASGTAPVSAGEKTPRWTTTRAWWQDRGARYALLGAAALFALFILVDGAPFLGADVGGVLTTLPCAAVVLLMLAGYRINLRRLAIVVLATVGLLAAATAYDLSRPADRQTHLGRLASGLLHRGDAMATLSIRRKIAANFSMLHTSWIAAFLGAIAVLVILAWLRPYRRVDRIVPGVWASVVGIAVVGLLAAALNDSGVSMPATMAGIYLPFLLYIVLRLDLESGVDVGRTKAGRS